MAEFLHEKNIAQVTHDNDEVEFLIEVSYFFGRIQYHKMVFLETEREFVEDQFVLPR